MKARPAKRCDWKSRACELNNELSVAQGEILRLTSDRDEQKGLFQFAVAEKTKIEKDRSDLKEQVGKLEQLNEILRKSGTDRVNTLKAMIAHLEQQVAELQGYSRALQDQIALTSEVVELPQPPIVTTRHRIASGLMTESRPAEPRYFHRDTPRDTDRDTRPKHWTAV